MWTHTDQANPANSCWPFDASSLDRASTHSHLFDKRTKSKRFVLYQNSQLNINGETHSSGGLHRPFSVIRSLETLVPKRIQFADIFGRKYTIIISDLSTNTNFRLLSSPLKGVFEILQQFTGGTLPLERSPMFDTNVDPSSNALSTRH